MNKLQSIQKIKELYATGQNIMEFLRTGSNSNDIDSIMISYDFQAGSYIKAAEENSEYIENYTAAIQAEFNKLGDFQSIMEIGVGEATLMSPLMNKIDPENNKHKLGFDISWSRVRYGVEHSDHYGQDIKLFTANLFDIPLNDNSVDIIYTSHSLEPNGGREKEALLELYRVASKYIVLLEPDYENASEEAKARMEKHGYVKHLAKIAGDLDMEVVTNRPFEVFINPLNPTGLTVIKKKPGKPNELAFRCPITKTLLTRYGNVLFSEECGLVYPVIDEVPCLLENNAVMAHHFKHFNKMEGGSLLFN
jgi:ubiquinone/menaquinone biosynthesis C-methylase UbiE/uncharacterized protein YbaR (Trm112 family)